MKKMSPVDRIKSQRMEFTNTLYRLAVLCELDVYRFNIKWKYENPEDVPEQSVDIGMMAIYVVIDYWTNSDPYLLYPMDHDIAIVDGDSPAEIVREIWKEIS